MNFGKESVQKKRRRLLSKKKKIRKKCATILFELALIALFALIVCIGSAVYGAYRGILDSSPSIKDIDATPTGFLSTILDSKGNTTATLVASGSNRVYVTIDEIPLNLQNAFIAIEDSRFREHNGIDIRGIIRAGVNGILAGFHFHEGASTLTQQLLKNNVFTGWVNEKSSADRVKRKIQEQFLALELEKVQSKDWILENYLNTVNLGQNTLGVQSASRRYFGKDVSKLTLSECAVIAGITKNPSRYNPISHPDENAERRKKVLDDMKEQKLITKKQYKKAMKDDVYSRIQAFNAQRSDKTSVHSYFDDAVTEQVIHDLMEQLGYTQTEAYKALYNSGLTIYSTQDPDIQAICDEEVNDLANYTASPKTSFSYTLTIQKSDGTFQYYDERTMLSYYQSSNSKYSINFDSETEARAAVEQYKKDIMEDGDIVPENGETLTYTIQPQAALTIIDQETGEVKALVGGRGDKTANRTLNRATDSVRQPGSTFKILAAFAPAIDTGKMTLASVEDDAPYTYSNGTPLSNYDDRYRGFTTIREAITHSVNVVTVKTLKDIGIHTGYNYLVKRFGFTTLTNQDHTEALSLGGITEGVTNLELTAAYAAIANKGEYIKPRLYTKILDHEGNVLIDNQPQTHRAVKKTTAWLLTNAMQDVLTDGTGKAAYFDGMPLAGKTGTTTKNKDTLFAGFSPYYTCVVWGGFDDNTSQEEGTTSYSRRIWRSVMSRVHENLKYKEFKMPSKIITAEVCKKSGMPAKRWVCKNDPRGDMVISEYFVEGTMPEEECDHHVAIRICASSGMPAGSYCPRTSYASDVMIVGGSPDSEDGPYLYSGNYGNYCNIHTEPPAVDTPVDDTGIDDTGVDDTNTDDNTNADDTSTDDTNTDDTNTDDTKPVVINADDDATEEPGAGDVRSSPGGDDDAGTGGTDEGNATNSPGGTDDATNGHAPAEPPEEDGGAEAPE